MRTLGNQLVSLGGVSRWPSVCRCPARSAPGRHSSGSAGDRSGRVAAAAATVDLRAGAPGRGSAELTGGMWLRNRIGPWLQDHHRGLRRPPGGEPVQPCLEVEPPGPQARSFVALGRPGMHPARAIDEGHRRVGLGLEVEPPGRLAWSPPVHRQHNEVGTVLDVADDRSALPPGTPARGREVQRPPALALCLRGPQPFPPEADAVEAPVSLPGQADDPAGRKRLSSFDCARHVWSVGTAKG